MLSTFHIIKSWFFLILLVFICTASCGYALASEELLQKAAAEMQAKNYLKAREIYREAIISPQIGPLADQALFGLAQAEYLLKNYSESSLHLRRYVANKNAERRNEALFMLGSAQFFLNKQIDADRILATVGGDYADRARILRASIALQNQEFGLAERLFSQINKELLKTDYRAVYVQAMLLAHKGQGNQAVAAIDSIPASSLKTEDLRVERAVVYLLAGRTRESIALLQSYVQSPLSEVERMRARRALLRAYEQNGDSREVVKVGEDLLQYTSDDDIRRRVITAYDRLGDYENALKQASQLRDRGLRSLELEKRLRRVLEKDSPQSVDLVQRYAFALHSESPVLAQSAVYLIKQGKKNEGRALLQRAASANASSEASLALAEMYLQEGRYDDAKKMLQPLVANKQFGSNALVLLADIAARKGDVKDAIELLKQSSKLKKSGKNPQTEARLGDLYWKLGEKTTALKHYTNAADAGDFDAMIKLADRQYLEGRYKLAEKYYKKALEHLPKDSSHEQWLHYQYGKLTHKRDYLEKAAAAGGEIGEAAKIYLQR